MLQTPEFIPFLRRDHYLIWGPLFLVFTKAVFSVGPLKEMSFKAAEIVAYNQFTPGISAFQRLFFLQFSSKDKFLLVSIKSQAKK